jgi:SAM-dependent MidA family methyltransferase
VTGLSARLAERVRRDGPLRFDAFQEAALYDPDGGYYERPGRVGRSGDFITAASWHPAFARSLARVARNLREELGEPIDVVDVGAGEGELLFAIEEALSTGGFRFTGVDRSETRRARARERLPGAFWFSSLEELPRFSGLLIAYELFDALPVRALLFEGERLLERVVTLGPGGEGFAWDLAECADGEERLERFRARGIHLLRNQRLEVREGAARLASSLASRLSAGLLLVFDYGAPARALYSSARVNGTLEAFRAHRVSRDVLAEPGSCDITAWVDFTEIEEAFRASGLALAGLVSQSRFLAAAGIAEEIAAAEAQPSEAERLAERHAIGELVAPGGMGESIRVLVASRDTALGARFVEWPVPGIMLSNH